MGKLTAKEFMKLCKTLQVYVIKNPMPLGMRVSEK